MKLTEHFDLREFECHDGTQTPDHIVIRLIELAMNLEKLRAFLGAPISITSGYRTEAYNKKVGGAPHSQHVQGLAADIHVQGLSPEQVAAKIEELIANGDMKQGGLGIYRSWVHYDIRGVRARWRG